MSVSPSSAVRAITSMGALALCLAMSTACSDEKQVAGGSTTVPPPESIDVATTVSSTIVADTVAATVVDPVPESVPPTVAPTFLPPPVCADSSAPSEAAISVTVVSGDWNGDGVVDEAVSWGEQQGGSAVWFVRTQVSGGAASTAALGSLGVGFAEVLDSVDVDFSLGAPAGTNRDEVLAIVGSNSSGHNLGVFGVDANDCIFRFQTDGGEPYQLPVHGAMATMSGVMCDGGAGSQFLVRLEAQTADGANWTTRDTKVVRTGAMSLGDGVSIPGALITGAPALARYGNAECFGAPYFGG